MAASDSTAGFRPEDFGDFFRDRPYRPKSFPVEPGERTRAQAIRHVLFREGWDPSPRDERTTRWASLLISLLLNLFFAVLMIYFMYVQYLAMVTPPEEEQTITMVEFIGRGNKVEGGGNAQPSQQTATNRSAQSSASASASAASATPKQAPEQTTAPASPPEPIAETPARVTLSKETAPEPDTFVLPDSRLPAPNVSKSPVFEMPQRDIVVRDVGEPVQRPNVSLPAPSSSAASQSIAVPQRGLNERSIPSPQAGSSAANASAASTASTGASNAAATSSSSSGSASASRPTGTGTSQTTGPLVTTAPGGWTTRQGASDWGNSNRNRDGSNQGSRDARDGMLKGNDLFDEQGKPKLPYKGSASRNDPPGLRNGEIRDIDRAGTWRKRRPTDIGGSGSMVWLPNEDVLEELVRRGIKDFSIKIPGTSAVLKCRVSLLQLGGGCMPDDPNMQDQEAIARPPPKVPYKPELNQHNGGRQTDKPPEDFGPGAILPGQEIKKVQGTVPLPPPPPKKPTFKFGDEK